MKTILLIILTIAIFILNSWAIYTLFYKVTHASQVTFKHRLMTIGIIASSLAIGILGNLRFILYPAILILLIIISFIYKFFYKSRLSFTSLFFLSAYTVIIYGFTNELEEVIARWITQSEFDIPFIQLICYCVFACINVFAALKSPNQGFDEIFFFATHARLVPFLNGILFLLTIAASQMFLFRHPQSWFMHLFLDDIILVYLTFTVWIFALILLIIYYTNMKWRSQTNAHLHSIQKYTQEIEQLNEELNMFRHDSLNIFYSLELAIQKGEIDEIKRIYQEILIPSQQLLLDTQQQIEVLRRIKSMEVKSLINAKLRQAAQLKIDFSVVVTENISFECITNPLMFIRILAILLDNAIENSLKSDKPAICLLITQDEKQVRLVLQNTYDETSLPLEQFHKKYFTTKSDKKHHGLGLTFVHQMIRQDSHYELMTTVAKDFFTQELIIQKI